MGISEGTVHHILTDHLKLKKLCGRWVPDLLTPDQMSKGLECAKKLLKKYKNCNPNEISELRTGDETWMYYFESQ